MISPVTDFSGSRQLIIEQALYQNFTHLTYSLALIILSQRLLFPTGTTASFLDISSLAIEPDQSSLSLPIFNGWLDRVYSISSASSYGDILWSSQQRQEGTVESLSFDMCHGSTTAYYPITQHSIALNLTLMTAYHTKYSVPDRGILKI